MNRHNHIIQRQAIEVKVTSGENVAAVHDQVRNIYLDKIIPSLDILFSGISGDEVILRINNLQFDLGVMDGNKLEEQFTERMLYALRESLEKKLQFDIKDQDMELVQRQKSFVDTFFYFLESGQLPWWCELKDLGILEKEIRNQPANYSSLKSKLAVMFANQSESVKRLAFQFSDEFLEFVTQLYLPSFKPVALLKEIRSLLLAATGADPVYLRDLFWPTICKHLVLSPDRFHGVVIKGLVHIACEKHNLSRAEVQRLVSRCDVIVFPYLHSIFTKPGESAEEPVMDRTAIDNSQHTVGEEGGHKVINDDSDDKMVNDDLSLKELKDRGQVVDKNDKGAEQNNAGQQEKKLRKENREDFQEVQNRSTQNDREAEANSRKKDKKNQIAGTMIYPELAGLVILHPFLSSFFAGLTLTDGERFLNDDALYKAVALLGYVATGEIEVQEHRLIIPKLICGMDLSAPVKRDVLITTAERDEADKLLNAVITHWTALKNTSRHALRDTFLKREGKLSRTDNGWQLEVERRTWDILLSRLPWGFSMIKLPWMKELVFVNWG